MKMFGKIIPILILSLLISPILLLQSCGNKAPNGTIITVEPFGSTVITQVNPLDPTTFVKTQNYRVTVTGKDGLPMNGIKVDVFGTINSNSFIDSFGSAVPPGTAFNKETGDFGFFDFSIVAHEFVTLTFNHPTIASVAGAITGGNISVLANTTATFCYRVSAVDSSTPVKETAASPEVCGTITAGGTAITTGSVVITWGAVFGVNGYNVFGRTAPEGLLTASPLSAATLTYTDIGTTAPGATPTGSDPVVTPRGNNAISGTMTATSGASIATLNISF
jgi:hypothetical protein